MGFADQPVWPPMYKPNAYDAMVFTETGANGVHYYAMDSVGNLICIDSPTACIQEAINYVLSKPTGGKVYIRAGDYYLAPFSGGPLGCPDGYICVNIPYNAALIIEGDGDATRIHLPQNNRYSSGWLFYWAWNGTSPYTRKSVIRNIAFVNDVNNGHAAMDILNAFASNNTSSGLVIDNVSVYDIQGVPFDSFLFYILQLYDVTISRLRFFSINPGASGTTETLYFSNVAIAKVVDSFFFSRYGGYAPIENDQGTVLVDSVEIYGPWQYAFVLDGLDLESSIQVTNSIIGAYRSGSSGIQGYNMGWPSDLIDNPEGAGYVKFVITSSHISTPISYNAEGSTNQAYIVVANNYIYTGCVNYVVNILNPGSGQVYMDISDNVILMNYDPYYNYSPCGGNFISSINGNVYLRFRNNLVVDNGSQPMWLGGVGNTVTVEIENNQIYIVGLNGSYSARNQFFTMANSTAGGLVKFINNTVTWTSTPSSSTTFYLVYNPNSSGTYYIPNIIMKGNTFNFPTSNATFGGFIGSAGATTANPNALFVDLDNTFNLSGINLPYPSVSTPSVPASGTALQNTYPYPVEVYISGGSATAVQVTRGGVTYTVWSSSTATAIPPLLVRLEPGDSITITYSTAPTWVWVPAKYIR